MDACGGVAVKDCPPWRIEGVEYLSGTAGSLIVACPKCAEEHFRNPYDYFAHPEWHKCSCKTQMEPIRMDELEARWKPFWKSLGHQVRGIDYD